MRYAGDACDVMRSLVFIKTKGGDEKKQVPNVLDSIVCCLALMERQVEAGILDVLHGSKYGLIGCKESINDH